MAIPNIFGDKKKGNNGFLAGSYEQSVENILTEPQSKVRKFFMDDFVDNLIEKTEKAREKRKEKKDNTQFKTSAETTVDDVKNIGASSPENIERFDKAVRNLALGLKSLADVIEYDMFALDYIPEIARAMTTTFNDLVREFSTGDTSEELDHVTATISAFASSMASIAAVSGDIDKTAKSLKASHASFTVINSIVNSLSMLNSSLDKFKSEKLKDVARSMIMISSSIGVLALSLWGFYELVEPEMLMLPLLTISMLAGINAIATRYSKSGSNVGVLALSSSIGILALSLWAFSELVEPETIAAPILAIMGLAAATYLMTKITGKSGLKSNALVIGAASIGVLGLALWAFNELVDSEDMVIVPLLAIGGLAFALYTISKLKKNILFGSIALALSALTLFVLAEGISMFDDVKPESMLKAGLSIGGLTLALTTTGANGKNVLLGSAALILGSISIAILSHAIQKFEGIDTETLINAGLSVGGLTLALAATGSLGSQVLLGSVALTIGAFSVNLLGDAVKKFEDVEEQTLINAGLAVGGIGLGMAAIGAVGTFAIMGAGALLLGGIALHAVVGAVRKFSSVKSENVDVMSSAISGIGFSLAKIGNPFTVAFTLAGAAALGVSAIGLSVFTSAMVKIKNSKLTVKDSINASNIAGSFIDGITDVFERNKGQMEAAKLGIYSLSGIGSLLTDLAQGIQSMANLTFTEFEVKDGKIIPKRIVNLTPEHFTSVGRNVGFIISSLNEPLAKAGENSNIFGNSPVGRGIKNLTGLGGVLTSLAQGVQSMANLTFTEFEVKDGKIIPKSIVKLDNSHFSLVAQNTASIINSLTVPLTKAGEGGSFFSSSSPIGKGIKNLTGIGQVLTGLAQGVQSMANLRFNEYEVKDGKLVLSNTRQLTDQDFTAIGVNVGKIIDSMVKPLERIAEMDLDDAKEGIDIGNSISKFMLKTATSAGKFNETFAKTPIDTFKSNFDGYISTVTKSMISLSDAFNEETEYGGITKSFAKILTGSGKLNENMNGVAKGFAKTAKSYTMMVKSTDSLNMDRAKVLENIVTSIKDKEFTKNIELLTRAIEKLSKTNADLGSVIGGNAKSKSNLDKALEKDGDKKGDKKVEDNSMTGIMKRLYEIQVASAQDFNQQIERLQRELASIKNNQTNGTQVTKTKNRE